MAPNTRLHAEMLGLAGRVLLEYNESTGMIHRSLLATARSLTDQAFHLVVSYGGVAVSLGDETPVMLPVGEIRNNTAVQARTHTILEQVRRGEVDPATALVQLQRVEADTPPHPRWVAILVLGIAAAALAALLGADGGTVTVVGLSTGLGLFVRRELSRWRFGVLALPLVAAFLGAVLGGLAIRLGWALTPELVLLVPALMLVPGPHLINAMLDLVDNHLPMSIARLGLALGILLANALGVVCGVLLTLPGSLLPMDGVAPDRLNLVTDMALAGVVTCGFAVVYNSPWRLVGLAVVGGMVGHGLRFLALREGYGPEAATFFGGLAVGVVAAGLALHGKTPFAAVAFAGAVTMMPGLQIYHALGGALKLARQAEAATPALLAGTIGYALQGCLVVAGLALGLVLGAWVALALSKVVVPVVAPPC